MCKLSNDIKLCSCGDKKLPLNNIWILRANSISNTPLVGEFFAPEDEETEIDKWNYKMLLKKLNQKNLFDFDYVPENGDELEITIRLGRKRSEKLNFVFYYDKRWIKEMPMEFFEETHIKHQGIINNAIMPE